MRETTAAPDTVAALVESGRLAALGELASGAAHEINNPLFAILTLVGFLVAEAEPGTKTHERLRLIEDSAGDIKRVVEQFHGFARDRGAEQAEVVLEEAAHAAVELVRGVGATRTVAFEERYRSAPSLVTGVPARLRCLFVHLLVNAVQAMPSGGAVAIEIEQEAGDVVARVRDEGPGIPPGDAELVFEVFHTTREGSGSGLGLAAARAVAESHGGSLAVEADPGAGACLVLRLPESRP